MQAGVGMGAPSGKVVAFQGVGKTFPGGTEAVRDVSFALEPGEFLAVVGPSGCGKSTLLPWRTVRKNVELLAELDGAGRRERQSLADEAIRLVGLQGFEEHYPKALSGGMKMRASLARALTTKPPLFLLDEPFGALDEITRGALNEELLRLFVSERFAAIFITHSISEAVFLSSRVLVMSPRPGRIVADVRVPFPYPRSPDLRFEPAFGELASEVSHALREVYG